MSSSRAAAASTLSLFEPPYQHLVPCAPGLIATLTDVESWRGRALVWQLVDPQRQRDEFDQLRYKPLGMPLLVLLPPPADVHRIVPMLPLVRGLSPRMVLPHGVLDATYRIRQLLSAPPRHIPDALTDYLIRRGLLRHRRAVLEFRRIAELAADTRSIADLARRMYTSRRSLGRHFVRTGLPVPSHCLQFARMLHVAVHLQTEDGAVFRIAARFGYPDGFTLSNQMKRLIGYRPTEVRGLIGWEWLVEAWLKKERRLF